VVSVYKNDNNTSNLDGRQLNDGRLSAGLPDLVDGQVADAVRLDVFERGPVPVRAGAQRQIDFVDHDGFHLFDAQFGNSCGPTNG